MKIDKAIKDLSKFRNNCLNDFKVKNVNKHIRAMIINFGDERGDIVVSNDNFGTRRVYPDFTNGKKNAGLHPLQCVFPSIDMMRACKDRYVGADGKVYTFGVDDAWM